MKNNKVVFVSTIIPYPMDSGKKIVLSGFIEYLLNKYEAKNIFYIAINNDTNIPQELPFKCYFINKPSTFEQIWNIFWHVLIRKDKSIQESMLYSKSIKVKLYKLIQDINPDLLIVDTLRTSQYFEESLPFSIKKKVLYLDDLFSVRYSKMIEAIKKYSTINKLNVLGNFTGFVPGFLKTIIEVSSVQKIILKFEQHLVEKREKECIQYYDVNLLINDNEVNLLKKLTLNKKPIYPVSPFLNIKSNRGRNYNGRPVFVFLGALNIPHNQVSILYFIETQFSELISRLPDIQLRIIGKNPQPELISAIKKYQQYITIEGFVEDLNIIFSESCAMLIPLLFGSGVKLKTLEAFAYGLPVISTDFGVEGIPVSPGLNCIVENNINNFPKLMAQLCDKAFNDNISRNAKELFLQRYSKLAIYDQYKKYFSL